MNTTRLIAVATFLCLAAMSSTAPGRGFGGAHGGGGFGGGGFGGGGLGAAGGRGDLGGGFGGAGFGGAGFGAGGLGGRVGDLNVPRGGLGGVRPNDPGGGLGGAQFGGRGPLPGGLGAGGEFGGLDRLGGAGAGANLGRLDGAGISRSQLNSFLGLPTDAGLHAAGGDIGDRGQPFGGFPTPAGRTALPGLGVDRPGISGYASNTLRQSQALAAHRWYDGNRIFSPAWSADHPWAWHPARYPAGDWARRAWRYATWPAVGVWLGWGAVPINDYDYGDTLVYQGDLVYLNGQPIATAQEYYQQAAELAGAGSDSDSGNQADSNADWLPLGVYGLMRTDQKTPQMMFQLAVDKQGDIRGNYYTPDSNKMEAVHGSIDKASQRAAWTVGDNNVVVVETGLYNLTQDQSTALVHLNSEKAEIYTLVRMKPPAGDGQSAN